MIFSFFFLCIFFSSLRVSLYYFCNRPINKYIVENISSGNDGFGRIVRSKLDCRGYWVIDFSNDIFFLPLSWLNWQLISRGKEKAFSPVRKKPIVCVCLYVCVYIETLFAFWAIWLLFTAKRDVKVMRKTIYFYSFSIIK